MPKVHGTGKRPAKLARLPKCRRAKNKAFPRHCIRFLRTLRAAGAQMERLLEVVSAPGAYVAISAIDGMGGVGKACIPS
jgi:hypothetical protein